MKDARVALTRTRALHSVQPYNGPLGHGTLWPLSIYTYAFAFCFIDPIA